MNQTPPGGRIIPLRQGVCGWCVIGLIVLPWIVAPLAVWAYLTWGGA